MSACAFFIRDRVCMVVVRPYTCGVWGIKQAWCRDTSEEYRRHGRRRTKQNATGQGEVTFLSHAGRKRKHGSSSCFHGQDERWNRYIFLSAEIFLGSDTAEVVLVKRKIFRSNHRNGKQSLNNHIHTFQRKKPTVSRDMNRYCKTCQHSATIESL